MIGGDIELDSIRIIEPIGKGNFVEIFKALLDFTTVVAVKKVMNFDTLSGQQSFAIYEKVLRDYDIFNKLKHKYILKCFGICRTDAALMIIIEYMNQKDMQSFLRKNIGNLSQIQLLQFCKNIAEAMLYLEKNNMYHRDLSSKNILVAQIESTNEYIAKISDFGFTKNSKYLSALSHETRSSMGRWTPPESIIEEKSKEIKYSSKADVWSFGLLCWEIFTYGREPFEGITSSDVKLAIIKDKIAQYHPKPNDCTDKFYDNVIKKCWTKDITARLSFSQIVAIMQEY